MTYTDLIFLFGLFPLSAMVSLLDRSSEFKNMILILTSLLFFSWGRPFAVCLIFLSIIAEWLLGFAAQKLRGEKNSFAAALPAVIVSGCMDIGLLTVFSHNYVFPEGSKLSLESALLPIGVSYYALRGFSYVYDVAKGKIRAEKNIFCLMTYMVPYFFMCAGPVVRYGDMESQIRSREVTTEKLNAGLNKIFWGLGKAVLLGNVFRTIKLAGLNGNEITTLGCWLGMLAFFAESYFVFTGLCDMSRGLSLVSGFILPINYKDIEPDELFTGLIRSFNTTVSGFFIDASGLNDPNRSSLHTFLGAVFCGTLMGFWYEAKLNFIIIGAIAGLIAAAEQLAMKKFLVKMPLVLKYVYLVLLSLIVFGALYFGSFEGYRTWLAALAGIGTKYTLSVSVKNAVLNNITLIIIAFFIICPDAKKFIIKVTDRFSAKNRTRFGFTRAVKTICTVFVFVLSVMTLVIQTKGL